MNERMSVSSDFGHPIVYELDSNMHVLASHFKDGKRKLTKPSNDSDDDSAGMEYIQDMLDNF